MAYSNFQNTSAFLGTYEAALKWFRPLIRPLPCMLDVALQVLRLKKKKKGGGGLPSPAAWDHVLCLPLQSRKLIFKRKIPSFSHRQFGLYSFTTQPWVPICLISTRAQSTQVFSQDICYPTFCSRTAQGHTQKQQALWTFPHMATDDVLKIRVWATRSPPPISNLPTGQIF